MTPLFIFTEQPLPEHLAYAECLPQPPASGVYLCYTDDGLSLCRAGSKGRVQADFTGGAANRRRLKGGGELIAKAVNRAAQPAVWDATGGLGRDSFVLAGLGLAVRVYERHPVVYALLADGIVRALRQPETAETAARITLVQGDAAHLLREDAARLGKPDAVYLDPMYPERQKSAAVKKEMAYFHELVGPSAVADEAALFQAALETAAKRIIVKRPRLGEFLCDAKPAYQYTGKSTRFDVYLPVQAA